MQYILREDFEDYVRLSIEIEDCGKSGLKVMKKYTEDFPELLELHVDKAKKAIARSVFQKHGIIIEDYVPHFSELFDTDTNKLLLEGMLTKGQIIGRLKLANKLKFFNVIPEHFFKDKNEINNN